MQGHNGAYRSRTSSLTTAVEAVTYTIQWLASQRDTKITHVMILTYSVNLLQNLESTLAGTQPCTVVGCKTFVDLLPWPCRSHGGVLRSLRNFVTMDRPERYSIGQQGMYLIHICIVRKKLTVSTTGKVCLSY